MVGGVGAVEDHITSLSHILGSTICTRAYGATMPKPSAYVPRSSANVLQMALMQMQAEVVQALGEDAAKEADTAPFKEVLDKKKAKLRVKKAKAGSMLKKA